MLTNVIFSVAEVIFISSYFFSDILLLRITTIIGLFGFIAGAFIAGYKSEGMLALIIFNSIGIVTNIVQIYRIIIQRVPILLPPELKDIYSSNFSMMSPKTFLKIYKFSKIKIFNKGEKLTNKGLPIHNLLLIKKGLAKVEKNNMIIAQLRAGFFIGEMSFLVNGPAYATVEVLSEHVECIYWDKEDLKELEKEDTHLYHQLREAIALNLVKKLDEDSTANI